MKLLGTSDCLPVSPRERNPKNAWLRRNECPEATRRVRVARRVFAAGHAWPAGFCCLCPCHACVGADATSDYAMQIMAPTRVHMLIILRRWPARAKRQHASPPCARAAVAARSSSKPAAARPAVCTDARSDGRGQQGRQSRAQASRDRVRSRACVCACVCWHAGQSRQAGRNATHTIRSLTIINAGGRRTLQRPVAGRKHSTARAARTHTRTPPPGAWPSFPPVRFRRADINTNSRSARARPVTVRPDARSAPPHPCRLRARLECPGGQCRMREAHDDR